MRINKIQNNEANKNHIKFKGNVSPEFVRYVRESKIVQQILPPDAPSCLKKFAIT